MNASNRLVNPLDLFNQLEEILPEDSVLVADGGDFVATGSYVSPTGCIQALASCLIVLSACASASAPCAGAFGVLCCVDRLFGREGRCGG